VTPLGIVLLARLELPLTPTADSAGGGVAVADRKDSRTQSAISWDCASREDRGEDHQKLSSFIAK
jgi:hypothetical protein